MKKFRHKILIGLMTITTIFGASACGTPAATESDLISAPESESSVSGPTWEDNAANEKIMPRPLVNDGVKEELLDDLNFSRGLAISKFHSNTSGGIPFGTLDYGGIAADGENVWSMGQWGCTRNMMDATFRRDGSVLSYYDGSKTFEVDSAATGRVKLGIKGSVEYGTDENGQIRDRLTSSENWPHNIIGQNFHAKSLKGAQKIYWECDYNVTQCDRLTGYPVDPALHAAQFQWFVSMTNLNPESESYQQSMWFGFSMFDTRAIGSTPSGMAAYDGGKEDNTGMFIYMFSLSQVDVSTEGNRVDLPSSVIGRDRSVRVDVVPFIKAGLKSAQKQGALKGATINDLVLGSTNIGWEIPGNYDCMVEIRRMNMYIEK